MSAMTASEQEVLSSLIFSADHALTATSREKL